jgi:hypothetical protein
MLTSFKRLWRENGTRHATELRFGGAMMPEDLPTFPPEPPGRMPPPPPPPDGPGDAPEIPPDEPQPVPVQDPPPQPNEPPLVVSEL